MCSTTNKIAAEATDAGRVMMLDLLDALDCLVYMSDTATHELLYANRALRGLVSGDTVGRKCHQAIHGRPTPCAHCTNKLITGPNLGKTHVWNLHDDARGRWYHCIDRAMPCRDGRIVRCSIALDITQHRQAEEQLRRRADDFVLMSALNDAVNRGEPLSAIIELLGSLTRSMFNCSGVSIYLLSQDRTTLCLQNIALAPALVRAIERLIGMPIPTVRIVLREGGIYERILRGGRPVLTNDSQTIRAMACEQTENPALQALVPAVVELVGIHSVISVPLVTEGETIGIMDVSRRKPFEAEDLQRFVAFSSQFAAFFRRYRAEQELRQSEETFRALSEQSPNMIWINCRGRIVYVNQAGVDATGYTREELCSPEFDYLSLIAPECHATIRDAFARHSRGEEVPPYEYTLVARDGRRIEALALTRLIDYGGQRAILGTVVDITARKVAERERELARQELAQAERLKAIGAAAAGLAHDFNNLLMGIRGFAEMIDLTLGKDHPARADIEQIYAVTERANELTRQMLLFGRKRPVALAPASLNAIISSLRPVIERTAGDCVVVELHLAPDLRQAHLNRGQIEQAIINLICNARDAMPEGGTLTIATANVELDSAAAQRIPGGRPGSFVLLRISDDGCGMDDATRQRIFEPFFTTKPSKRGSGLGLAVVYGTVQQHDGMIKVESSPGKGATFELFLPALAKSEPCHS